jgi:hypothetical protein
MFKLMLMWPESANRNQKLGVRNQNQERGGEPEYTPPHSMSCGAVDENRRCKRLYPKDLRQPHPQLKCLSCGAVDTGPMSPPTYYGQRDNGCHEWEKMPIFMAFLSAYPLSNRLDNGTTDDLLGIHKKAVCMSRRNALYLARRGVDGGVPADCAKQSITQPCQCE